MKLLIINLVKLQIAMAEKSLMTILIILQQVIMPMQKANIQLRLELPLMQKVCEILHPAISLTLKVGMLLHQAKGLMLKVMLQSRQGYILMLKEKVLLQLGKDSMFKDYIILKILQIPMLISQETVNMGNLLMPILQIGLVMPGLQVILAPKILILETIL